MLGFPLLGWYLGLLTDKAFGQSENPEVQRRRGVELRQHLVRSQSVALIKVSFLSEQIEGAHVSLSEGKALKLS